VAALLLCNIFYAASVDDSQDFNRNNDLRQNQEELSEDVILDKQRLEEDKVIKRLFDIISGLENELNDFAISLSEDDMNSNAEKVMQNINAYKEKIRKEKEALVEYICSIVREKISLYLEEEKLYRWKLANILVDKISDIHGIPLDNIKLNRFEDEYLIPEKSRAQSICSVEWGILKLDDDKSFRPFEKINEIEFEKAIGRFGELLINLPGFLADDESSPVSS